MKGGMSVPSSDGNDCSARHHRWSNIDFGERKVPALYSRAWRPECASRFLAAL